METPLSTGPMRKAFWFMLVLVAAVVTLAELRLRSTGMAAAFDDGPPLWTNSRKQVYADPARTVVFIGSSRIKFDLDLELWEQLTGTRAVQLAFEGSNPRPGLSNLAADPQFRGRLVVDVTEGLFFSTSPHSTKSFDEGIAYYHDETPAQKAGFQLNRVLESSLVLLDKDNFSMNACLDALEIPSREGVFMMPVFPMEFSRPTFQRETNMTRQFESDTLLQRRVKDIWAFFAKFPDPPLRQGQKDSLFASIRDDVAKIKSRGGDVVFVRTPSNEPMYSQEIALFPRDDYWERLLRETGCKGIHFMDFEPIRNLHCPELSHLSTSEKKVFTRHFAALLANEVGWTFPQKPPTPQQ